MTTSSMPLQVALQVDQPVRDRFPQVRIALVVARQLCGAARWPDAELALAELESEVAAERWQPQSEDDPGIAAWHRLYRDFGTNPRRVRPSVDALCRRLRRTGRLPRINGAVDAYNAVSVRHALPAGAFDLAAVRGTLRLRTARQGDAFTPLGEPDVVEHPGGEEVVYVDDESVLTRHWNHRDADRTKVTEQSQDVVFLLESAHGEAGESALAEAVQDLVRLVQPHAGQVASRVVSLTAAPV